MALQQRYSGDEYYYEMEENFLEELNIRVIPGIGKKTEQKFKEMNLETIQEIKNDVIVIAVEFEDQSPEQKSTS